MAPWKFYIGDETVAEYESDEEEEEEKCEACEKEGAEDNGLCHICNELLADFLAEYKMLPDFLREYVNDNPECWQY